METANMELEPEAGKVSEKKPNLCVRVLKDNLLIIFIIIAVAIGVGLGIGLRGVWTFEEYRKIYYLEFPGRILLNMLKLLILPLIISSLVTGLASIGSHTSGKLGAAAVCYYLSTTLAAVIIGIILVLTIHPGSKTDRESITRAGSFTNTEPLDALFDLVSQCFPENIVSACFQRVVTEVPMVKSEPRFNETSNSTYTVDIPKPKLVAQDGTNVLGIVVFSIALGCVINHLGEEGRPLKNLFHSLNSATMVLVGVVIWFTPVGLVFLIASKFISTQDIMGAISDLGKYMGVVLGGLAIHGFVVLPLIYLVCTRRNPAPFALNMVKALLTAWGTASSSATLPITMDCLVNKNKVNINIVRFVVPIGATINMDGTALYEAVACIFIAQVNGLELEVADVIVVSLTATAAAIGAAGVPQAGLVTLVIVLTAVGLPTEDVTLILSIDWLLDRFRTVINVWGDCVGAGILNHFFRNNFPQADSVMEEDIVTSEDVSKNNSPHQGEKSPINNGNQSYGIHNPAFEPTVHHTKM